MTSLNGPGFSITLLRASTDMLRYLDAPTSALGWSRSAEHNTVVPCSFAANTTPMDLPGANAQSANTNLPGPKGKKVLEFDNLFKNKLLTRLE